jgi:hypothetical protein
MSPVRNPRPSGRGGSQNGPLIALRNTLPPERYSALMTQLDELVDQFNRATDGTVAIDVEYLQVVARKP